MKLSVHPFTLRQLQYAVAVAEYLSFRKAAEHCGVSQPSLSAQIAELEAALSLQLFERDRRKVLVTGPGQALLTRAREILRNADDLEIVARRAHDPLTGTMRFGVIPTISPYLLPRLCRKLKADYPQLNSLWVEEKTEVLVAQLEAGKLDAALLALEAEIGEVEYETIGNDPFVLATPEGHPLAGAKQPVDIDALRDASVLLLDEGHCFREQALAVCSRAQAHELEFRATSLSTLAQMVASGAGVTLLPEMAVKVEVSRANLVVRMLRAPLPGRTIVLAWRSKSPLSSAFLKLAQTFRLAYVAGEET